MSEPIKVGDLVQVVRACRHCGETSDLGLIFRVAGIEKADGGTECCGNNTIEPTAFPSLEDNLGWPVYLLKRIPPLEELEGEKNKEELTA